MTVAVSITITFRLEVLLGARNLILAKPAPTLYSASVRSATVKQASLWPKTTSTLETARTYVIARRDLVDGHRVSLCHQLAKMGNDLTVNQACPNWPCEHRSHC